MADLMRDPSGRMESRRSSEEVVVAATARAAANIMPSVISVAPAAIAPSPNPDHLNPCRSSGADCSVARRLLRAENSKPHDSHRVQLNVRGKLGWGIRRFINTYLSLRQGDVGFTTLRW